MIEEIKSKIEDLNNNLKKEIQSKYAKDIKYLKSEIAYFKKVTYFREVHPDLPYCKLSISARWEYGKNDFDIYALGLEMKKCPKDFKKTLHFLLNHIQYYQDEDIINNLDMLKIPKIAQYSKRFDKFIEIYSQIKKEGNFDFCELIASVRS